MNNRTTIYIVRHGETHGNVREIITGHYNSRLTEKGKEQARAVGEKLKNIKFAKIFSSDLTRAKHTAKIIADMIAVQHEIDPLLKEKSFGIFEGKKISTFHLAFDQIRNEANMLPFEERKKWKAHESIENDEEIFLRFTNFISKIKDKHQNQNVLAVSHMSYIRSLLIHFGFTDYQNIYSYSIENTGYVAIETDGINFQVKETSGVNRI
jgi:broad specificity phosphatase PhoE